YNSTQGSCSPKLSSGPVTLLAWTSLSQNDGNGGKSAENELVAPGVNELVEPADQLATRLLSCVGSTNCSELPARASGHGLVASKRTRSTTRLPGVSRLSVSPSDWMFPENSSK